MSKKVISLVLVGAAALIVALSMHGLRQDSVPTQTAHSANDVVKQSSINKLMPSPTSTAPSSALPSPDVAVISAPPSNLVTAAAPLPAGSTSPRSAGIPASSAAQRNAADLGGLELTAQVQVGKNDLQTLTPNELGLFPRVVVGAKSKIQITAAYPGAAEGEQVVISAEDGGQLDNGKPVMIAALGANGVANFNFTTSADEGVFRVTLRKGADEKQFDFWVGPEPQIQK